MVPLVAAALIGGAVQGGTSLISGILNYYATKDVNKKNREIFDIQRSDQLESEKYNRGIAREQLTMNKRQQAFNENEAKLNRAENLEQKGYGRLMNAYQRGANILTQQMNFNQMAAAPYQKYAGK